MTRGTNMLKSPSRTHSRRFGVKSIPLRRRAVAKVTVVAGFQHTPGQTARSTRAIKLLSLAICMVR
jgi:hypothetical protein